MRRVAAPWAGIAFLRGGSPALFACDSLLFESYNRIPFYRLRPVPPVSRHITAQPRPGRRAGLDSDGAAALSSDTIGWSLASLAGAAILDMDRDIDG